MHLIPGAITVCQEKNHFQIIDRLIIIKMFLKTQISILESFLKDPVTLNTNDAENSGLTSQYYITF